MLDLRGKIDDKGGMAQGDSEYPTFIWRGIGFQTSSLHDPTVEHAWVADPIEFSASWPGEDSSEERLVGLLEENMADIPESVFTEGVADWEASDEV